MNRLFVSAVFTLSLLTAGATAMGEETLDAVSKQAATIEAELGKFRDTAPEVADLLVKLVDLYHANGRVFGLIRAGETLVTKHPTHPQHKAVTLKLIDGLQAMSRNKELTASIRQFIQRYPQDPECARLEEVLAQTLNQMGDRVHAAEAFEVVYRRQPDSPKGRNAGVSAIALYGSLNTNEAAAKAAELAEVMVDKLPATELAAHIGWSGIHHWRRLSQWAKSNAIAAKMTAKGVPTDKSFQRDLLHIVAENYHAMSQWANAGDTVKKVRALGDDFGQMWRQAYFLNNAQVVPAELEPVVAEMIAKDPKRAETLQARSYLMLAYFRAMDKPKALAILKDIVNDDATTNGNATLLVQHIGAEPAQLAEAEQILLGALAKNEKHATYIRYVLATELYRDRIHDNEKARQMFNDLITKSPSDDGYTQQTFLWLLGAAKDDNEFNNAVGLWVQLRKDHPEWNNLRGWLSAWAVEAEKNAALKARADYVKQQAAALNTDADKKWVEAINGDLNISRPAREWLFAPERVGALKPAQLQWLVFNLSQLYRQMPDNNMQVKGCALFGQYLKQMPQDWGTANHYLHCVTDTPNVPMELQKQAVEQCLAIEPTSASSDVWWRMYRIADAAKDIDLVKRVYAWTTKAIARFGLDGGGVDAIGDTLERAGLKAEAMAFWEQVLAIAPPERGGYIFYATATRIIPRKPQERKQLLEQWLPRTTDFHGWIAGQLIDDALRAGDLDAAEKICKFTRERQEQRPFGSWGLDENSLMAWIDHYRNQKDLKPEVKLRVFTMIRDLNWWRPTAMAKLAILEMTPPDKLKPMERLLAYADVTNTNGDDATDWERMMPYVQGGMTRKDYPAAATLLTAMLANLPTVDEPRRQAGRTMVGQCYARMGGVGLAIDESNPIAPLMQAALYLRLGDERLALEAYSANRKLFDEHQGEMPVDLVRFVCENLTASGGDANLDKSEEILRNWLVKNAEAPDLDDTTKAGIQVLLAKNYFQAQRYDVARNEYTTVINRYGKTPQAIEADFGIGESFMAQKVYDQAETVFERLANSRDRDVVVRAEFLRGVLASRRGDRDQAREIFRTVLDRVPNIELANQALYNLSEVYGAEERYMDQLELLRTVGRLGRASKRWHQPGTALSIVVQDSDLGISRGHAKIPVRVSTEPGGDEETVYLYSGGAGKGLFRADIDTRLGQVTKLNKTLELTGKDSIHVDYPADFKAEFKNVPLSDADIKVAANAKLILSTSKFVDEEEESFTQRMEREAREREFGEFSKSLVRPWDQIKPGNPVYLHVEDADRDLGDDVDKINVKLMATSGDQVQLNLMETGPHTGIFEAVAQTGELPAGALASDTAINHSPLMAIDQDKATFWLSEPDGTTPKWLAVDMKDLNRVDRVAITSPDATKNTPVRGELQGSYDGRMWFRIASHPALAAIEAVAGESGRMGIRVFPGNFLAVNDWKQIVEMTKTVKPIEEGPVNKLNWALPQTAKDAQSPVGVLWHGKFVQPKAGTVRLKVHGGRTAVAADGIVELPLGPDGREVDLWFDVGTHDLTIFSALQQGVQNARVELARGEDYRSDIRQFSLHDFRTADFDLDQEIAKPAKPRTLAEVKIGDTSWDFNFEPMDLRYVKFVIHEYRGEAVAINRVAVANSVEKALYIPTKSDVLSLASNESLELAAGDKLTAQYVDEITQNSAGSSQLLDASLSATYFDGRAATIAYDFYRWPNGIVEPVPKQLKRIEPGERVIVQAMDFDRDQSGNRDEVKIEVQVNDGKPVELTAIETKEFSGIFTKEVDTVAAGSKNAENAEGKLVVKPGDRIICRYRDEQNTYPGHSVARETVVYVNKPSEAKIRIVETRATRPPKGDVAPPEITYQPPVRDEKTASVAFEAPLTVEVYDRDAAKNAKSFVTVQLETTSGAKIDVKCIISGVADGIHPAWSQGDGNLLTDALEEGRFIGQVFMQLGGKSSPDLLPLTANMPRNLIGSGVLPKESEDEEKKSSETVIVRVLNVGGSDTITATYNDERRPKGKATTVSASGRVIASGELACVDREYDKPVKQLHVGEKMFLMVTDADLDMTDERDVATLEIATTRGDKETIKLEETLNHSGLFTGSITLKPSEKPTPGNIGSVDPSIETYFGDSLTVEYHDAMASTDTGKLDLKLEIPVVVGTDGSVSAFSKMFPEEELAVETQFHVAESYFELFKSHKQLGRKEDQQADLESGRRVLKEVMEDYPNPRYVPRVAYLLGQFSQELGQFDEAITSYQLIVRQFNDSSIAPDAQYKLAQCYEDSGDFENALESYVTLAATYPKSPLIANVMVRISDHFYKKENYVISANVGEKFLEKFESHEWGPRIAFRVGQCYYKGKQFQKSSKAFDNFAKNYPDDQLAADALFWSGESHRMSGQLQVAFRRYNRCRWDFPSSDAAKYARGRLAMPEMIDQFEKESALEQ